jgi:alpha-glucosidase (family GH31 glycosyl hydrolase)
MDWHITHTGNRSSGWTGYTWNRQLFPDPPGFIARLHELGLKTALNLHPADGVYPHEEQYPNFARFMGIDPQTGDPLPFDCADPRFMQAYFEILHHPLEESGVDFWWIDWQQGAQSRQADLDPLWWLNHLHFHDLGRDGSRRPFIFSRWGGLGNHRYPIGFSGDTVIGWEALHNLPGFTATAANVGYGWWSHDIGGHMGGIEDDELYARWVQYGVFSPILRLHSTNNLYHERRPWERGPAAGQAAGAAMRLRHALIPYIYSMAWRNYTTSMPLVTPMYYSHPEYDESYQAPQQYWFGSELLAAPFTTPASVETGLNRQLVWLPPGSWFDFFSGELLAGGRWQAVYGLLDDIPLFAPAGAIVPMAPETGWGGIENPSVLQVQVFAGASRRFDLVEDDGHTSRYLEGCYAMTAFEQIWRENELLFTIAPARGDLSVLPAEREYCLSVRGVVNPQSVQIVLNGDARTHGFHYDPHSETLSIEPFTVRTTDDLRLTVSVQAGSLLSGRDRRQEKLRKYLRAFHLDSWVKNKIDSDWGDIQRGTKSLRSYHALSDAQFSVLASLL